MQCIIYEIKWKYGRLPKPIHVAEADTTQLSRNNSALRKNVSVIHELKICFNTEKYFNAGNIYLLHFVTTFVYVI